MEDLLLKKIAVIHTDFKEKFGIPRQSGLVKDLSAKIVFCPEYRNADAVRGLEQFSHLWLIWEFSKSVRDSWSPTVRPPRLGGNKKMGVFATRSPFRPNPIGLSCVAIDRIEYTEELGPIIYVKGADILDKTPIYDIKPYIPYADCHPTALCGFTASNTDYLLNVNIPQNLLQKLRPEVVSAVEGILAQDPRPSYQQDKDRQYGLSFAEYEIKFKVDEKELIVTDITEK